MEGAVCTTANVWRPEDHLVGSSLSFRFYAGSGDQTQITRLAQQASLCAESPNWLFQNFFIINLFLRQGLPYVSC